MKFGEPLISEASPLLLNKCGYGLNPTTSREKHLP